MFKVDSPPKLDSPFWAKKINKMGRNACSRFLNSNFRSANLSKSKNMNTIGNSEDNNTLSKNLIDEQINKKNCNIIRIFNFPNFRSKIN